MPLEHKVRILPELLINKIAAGEVVERPASVVKELVENSIDSGATQVLVTIKNGGKDLISVLDNGCGMSETDARFAIERHATSKIYHEDDLFRIGTLGFRGEALASIAAVSQFELQTCDDEAQGGTRLLIKGGYLEHQGRVGFPRGTKITVERLFYNTPARLKFLKSTPTELQHIQQLLTQLSLAYPERQFRLTHNQQLLLNLSAGQNLEGRIGQLFGEDLRDGLLAVEHQENYLRFEGMVSFPANLKHSRRWQYLFVNGRHVRCPALNHAIYDGYSSYLTKSQHPALFFKLWLDPSEVDVNVHPAKTEIRLRNPRVVHAIVADQLSRSLTSSASQRFFGASIGRGTVQENLGQFELPISSDAQPSTSSPKASRARRASRLSSKAPAGMPSPATTAKQPQLPPPASLPEPPDAEEVPTSLSPTMAVPPEPDSSGAEWRFLAVVGVEWALAQTPQGILILQVRQTQRRLWEASQQQQLASGGAPTRNFEPPLLFELSPQEALLLEQHLPVLQELGVQLEPFGGKSFSVQKAPEFLPEGEVAPALRELLKRWSLFGKRMRPEEVRRDGMEVFAQQASSGFRLPADLQACQAWLEQAQRLPHLLHLGEPGRAGVFLSFEELQERLGTTGR